MKKREIFAHIDHTLLSPYASWKEIQSLCTEAILNGAASVCIPPCYVSRAFKEYGERVVICTVIGFPLGYQSAESKIAEAENAVRDGAGEIDMVVNLGAVKNQEYSYIVQEIAAIKRAVGNRILKVIVETCYLTDDEKIALCRCVTDGGADYIKTSTGFGSGGAKLEDIELFKKHIGPNVKMKASGGIRTVAEIQAFLSAGCTRIGTSSAVKLLAPFSEDSDIE